MEIHCCCNTDYFHAILWLFATNEMYCLMSPCPLASKSCLLAYLPEYLSLDMKGIFSDKNKNF